MGTQTGPIERLDEIITEVYIPSPVAEKYYIGPFYYKKGSLTPAAEQTLERGLCYRSKEEAAHVGAAMVELRLGE